MPYLKCDSHVNIPQGDRGKPGPHGPPGEPGHKVTQICLSFYPVFRSFVQPPKWVFYQITNNPFKDPLHCLRCVLTNRMKETSRALCGMFSLCKVEKCMQQQFTLITAFKNGNIFAYIALLTSFLKDQRPDLTYFFYRNEDDYIGRLVDWHFLLQGSDGPVGPRGQPGEPVSDTTQPTDRYTCT